MIQNDNYFEWEDGFDVIENIQADLYVNDILKVSDVYIDKIEAARSNSGLLNIELLTKEPIYSDLIDGEKEIYNLKIDIKIREPNFYHFSSIVIAKAFFGTHTISYIPPFSKTRIKAKGVVYASNKQHAILKEWYGCSNVLNFDNGFVSSKEVSETTTYKNGKRVAFKISRQWGNRDSNSFWVKLDTYKFKISLIKPSPNTSEYARYVFEYREQWGEIPNPEVRRDISVLLSFIIGAKLIKFGESFFDFKRITRKEYLALSPIDSSLLYQANFPFYSDCYSRNDTDIVIKQIPKMIKRYFLLKEKYRLDEVLPALFVRSYLNFNFINYVTYIEMFANVEIEKKPTIISKTAFREVIKRLNQVKGIPKSIRDKFQTLNLIGVGKKTERLLVKHKIDYSVYHDVFSVRGRVVHGAKVDISKMYVASEKAKELLTILTLRKLGYIGFVRSFTNNNELISVRDMSKILL